VRLDTGFEYALGGSSGEYDIDEILDLIDPVAFLQREYSIDFVPASGELKACCPIPWHKDNTPSFYFNPSNMMWRCYGCAESGGIVGLVMKIESCPKMEAVMKLAEAAGYAPITDPSMVLGKTERAVSRLISEYMQRQGTAFPGQMSETRFMDTVRQKMERVRDQFGDTSETDRWIESVYMRLDDLLLAENHKGCRTLFDGLPSEIREMKRMVQGREEVEA
jgi:hypothetical protein